MSTLIVSPYFFQETAARAIQVRKLFEGLSQTSVDFILATLDYPNDWESIPENITLFKNDSGWRDRAYDGPVTKTVSCLADIITKKNITTILSISSPVYSAYVGLYLKKRLNHLRWICYFSDPMPPGIYPEPYFTGYSSLANRFKSEYQKLRMNHVLDKSDTIIFPSANSLDYFERVYNKSLAGKSTVIPHMGGTLEVEEQLQIHDDLKNRLVYFGDLYKRLSVPVMDAVKQAKKDFPDTFQGLVCYSTRYKKKYSEFLTNNNVADIVELKPGVPYQESLKLMRQSDVLFLIEADMEASPFMPSKYFDYLFANRPVLAVAPLKNSLSEHYKGNDDFLVVNHEPERIYSAIKTIFNSPRKKTDRDLRNLKQTAIIEQYKKVLIG